MTPPSDDADTLTLQDKIKQLIIVSGSYPGENSLAYRFGAGGVLFNTLSKGERYPKRSASIPVLRMTDIPILGY